MQLGLRLTLLVIVAIANTFVATPLIRWLMRDQTRAACAPSPAPAQRFRIDRKDISGSWHETLRSLVNTVRLSTDCPPWSFGAAALMRNLAARGLL